MAPETRRELAALDVERTLEDFRCALYLLSDDLPWIPRPDEPQSAYSVRQAGERHRQMLLHGYCVRVVQS